MTYKELTELIRVNNIPEDVTLQSDSGWEIDATDMDGVFYNPEQNLIVFTMEPEDTSRGFYAKEPWVRLEASQKAFKIKVGDKVRTVKEYADGGGGARLFPIGTIGTITGYNPCGRAPYLVQADTKERYWYQEDMLEPYEEKTYA